MINDKTLLAASSIVQVDGAPPNGHFKLCTDSRNYKSGEVFVALKGENFDGFKFIETIVKNDCPVVIYNHTELNGHFIKQLSTSYSFTCFIGVSDTILYLQQIGHLHIKMWLNNNPKRKVIGITGSNGKTTHKEMLFHFLSTIAPGKITATQGNLNNHIGVPLTLSAINEDHEMAIVEMGTNHPGEIPLLANLALPNSGLLTNIGAAHIEFFGSEENILKEKGTLYHTVVKNTKGAGEFVICADDQYLNQLPKSAGLITFGEERGQIKVSCEAQAITLQYEDHSVRLENKLITGKHNFKNMACAFILANKLYPGHEKALIEAATLFAPRKNRASWVELEGKNFFLDAYNANPASMKASLLAIFDSLKSKGLEAKDCLFVLGDMNELGDHAQKLHREIGELLQNLGAEHVAFIGRYNAYYREGFLKESLYFQNREDFNQKWPELRSQFNTFFLKASRSLQLESLLDIR